jgi:hypothetical protein
MMHAINRRQAIAIAGTRASRVFALRARIGKGQRGDRVQRWEDAT